MCCEWSAERYCVAVAVSVRPHGRDALHNRLVGSYNALARTIERQCHGFDARLTRNEKKTRKNWCANLCNASEQKVWQRSIKDEPNTLASTFWLSFQSVSLRVADDVKNSSTIFSQCVSCNFRGYKTTMNQ